MAFELIDSVIKYNYVLMDATYDSSDIYDYIFEDTHAMPFIETNRKREIIENELTYNYKPGIALRKKGSSRYKLRCDMERTFSILIEILKWNISGILTQELSCINWRNYSCIQLYCNGK